jgi:hypothetical protein
MTDDDDRMDDRQTEAGDWTGPIAADGARRYPGAHSLADFFRMIEAGQFDTDCADALQDAAATLEELAAANPSKIKASLEIKVEIVRDPDGIYFLTGAYKIKLPEIKRARSIAWLSPDNRFTPNRPNQGHLFGDLRDVTPKRDFHN